MLSKLDPQPSAHQGPDSPRANASDSLEADARTASALSERHSLACDIGAAARRLRDRGGVLALAGGQVPRLVDIHAFVESHGEAYERKGPLGPGALSQHYLGRD